MIMKQKCLRFFSGGRNKKDGISKHLTQYCLDKNTTRQSYIEGYRKLEEEKTLNFSQHLTRLTRERIVKISLTINNVWIYKLTCVLLSVSL